MGYDRHITRRSPENTWGRDCTSVLIIFFKDSSGSIIHTDEHKSYCNLLKVNFKRLTLCHKYYFRNGSTNSHTNVIESFHEELKLEMKKEKVLKKDRPSFLNVVLNSFQAILNFRKFYIPISSLLLFFSWFLIIYCDDGRLIGALGNVCPSKKSLNTEDSTKKKPASLFG